MSKGILGHSLYSDFDHRIGKNYWRCRCGLRLTPILTSEKVARQALERHKADLRTQEAEA